MSTPASKRTKRETEDNYGVAPAPVRGLVGTEDAPAAPAANEPEPKPNPNVEINRHGNLLKPHVRRDNRVTRQTSIAVHEDNDAWIQLHYVRNRKRYKTLSDIWNEALRAYRLAEQQQQKEPRDADP